MQITGHVVSNPGKIRANNEDSAALLWQQGEQVEWGLVVGLVADGMGGHECGEVASQLAAQVIPDVIFRSKREMPEALLEAFAEANRNILRASRAEPGRAGMGTTGAVVAVNADEAWCAWVGDSRIYLLRGCQCYLISEDHTLVAELARQGHLTAEEARHHEDRNVLSRALGTKPRVEVEMIGRPLRLQSGDRILICSDGLHDLVSDEEIAARCGAGELHRCAESVVDLALERGGYDNVSVVLMVAAGASASAPITREVTPAC